ncbi:MAG: DegT/DnrJ/EryC1/StrS family aminotransferase [Flavobacteriales bacterium]|nr:DegT/DnrJ/EryC1/StrS family aminotransferase [Flavobacteriales bacterium]
MELKKVFVTKPSLASLDTFKEMLEPAWESGILTHNGPLVQRFESELEDLYEVDHLAVVTNGTLAIQLAIRALNLKGEIITPAFTWIATASAIKWEGCIPVFVDVESDTYNIDPNKIEASIMKDTVAICAVHVFSNPCNVEAIEKIADKHNLKVIYDGAHASNVEYKGVNILEYGDISTVSFHATKLLNSGEGGACVSKSEELISRIKRLRFFGYDGQGEIVDEGCNGKMTEVHAALGLVNIPLVEEVIEHRKQIYSSYRERLENIESIGFQKINKESYNFSYMPITLNSEETLLKVIAELNKEGIYPRRYFYPSLNQVESLKDKSCHVPNSESLASRIICLPSHNNVDEDTIQKISDIITRTVSS